MSTPRPWVNIAVNLVGRLITAALGLFLSPYFFRHLGAEAYGLVGFYNAMATVLGLLNLGFGTVFATEVARHGRLATPEERQTVRDLVRTYGTLYGVLGLVIGVLCVLLSPLLAERAVHRQLLSLEVTAEAIRWMGLALVVWWPIGIFSGALNSLERQVEQNAITVVTTLLRSALLVVMLRWWTNDVRAYFALIFALTLASLVATVWVCWRVVSPSGERGRWRSELLRGHGTFAFHSTLIAVASTLLNQLDRLVVTKELPLPLVGYYSLATTLGQMMYFFATPVFAAYQPQLIQLAAAQEHDTEARIYRQATRIVMSMLVVPCSVLCLFPDELLMAWTHDPQAAPLLRWPLRLLVLATSIHGLMHIPYALMVARRWMSLSAVFNVSALIIMIPTAWWFTHRWGLTGAALSWLLVQSVNAVLSVTLSHRKLLPGRTSGWLWRDVTLPALPALLVLGLARALAPMATSRLGVIAELGLFGAIALAATLAMEPDARTMVMQRFRRQR